MHGKHCYFSVFSEVRDRNTDIITEKVSAYLLPEKQLQNAWKLRYFKVFPEPGGRNIVMITEKITACVFPQKELQSA